MTSLAAIRSARQVVESGARAEAARLAGKAAAPAASADDKTNAETAAIAIQIAEMTAATISRAWRKSALAEFEEFGGKLIDDAIARLSEAPAERFDAVSADVVGHGHALLDRKREMFDARLAQHALDAWLAAMKELAALSRPTS